MLENKITISVVVTIFLITTICSLTSAEVLAVTNNSDIDLMQNQSVDTQLITIENDSDTNTTQISDTDNYSMNSNPAIYGDMIVWQNIRHPDSNKDIYLYNIDSSTNNRITASGSASNPKIYGDKIVWEDSRSKDSDIYMYNLSTQLETQITSNKSEQNSPNIYGDKIVWLDDRNGGLSVLYADIYVYNLSTNTETRITTSTSASNPSIYGDRIVWQDSRNDKSDIYMYNLSTSVETQITNSGSAYSPNIYEDRLVWSDKGENRSGIYMYNLSTSVETQIIDKGSAKLPAIYGDRIVWEDSRNGWDKPDIYMYNLSTSMVTQITTSESAQYPVIYGDRIVWEDSRNGWDKSDIYIHNMSTSKEIQIDTSKLSSAVLGKNETGDIYVYTSLTWSPDTVLTPNATFTLFGPGGKDMGNGSYWAKLNAPKGTYTIRYGPVNGYDTPIPETKTLKEGDSIKFSGEYLLKRAVGDRLDFGDGYILIIKQIDPENKEVSLELQLDERKVVEERVREHKTIRLNKISYSVNESDKYIPSRMIVEKIFGDEGNNYTDFSFYSPAYAFGSIMPHTDLIIHSIPEGASIFLDGKYIGKTSKSYSIDELKSYSIHLEMEGYNSLDYQCEFYTFKQQEIQLSLSSSQNSKFPLISNLK